MSVKDRIAHIFTQHPHLKDAGNSDMKILALLLYEDSVVDKLTARAIFNYEVSFSGIRNARQKLQNHEKTFEPKESTKVKRHVASSQVRRDHKPAYDTMFDDSDEESFDEEFNT